MRARRQVTGPRYRVLSVGDSALLLEVDSLDAVLALERALRRDRPPGVLDVVPAARTVLIEFDAEQVARAQVSSWLAAAEGTGAVRPAAPETVVIPLRYDGADLAEVARLSGRSTDEVVALHAGADYTVAFCGFSPGFGYLTGLPAALTVPRRDVPRTRVPAGAVAVAGEYSAVYPRDSPGGWQLIGTTDLSMFDLSRDPSVLLCPGMSVRFRAERA